MNLQFLLLDAICPAFNRKLQGMPTGKKNTESEEKTIIVPDSGMPQMLELLDGEFKIIMINMLRALMVKVDSMQKQMGNISRGIETVRKSQK